jgi:hypothetical protein
VPVVIKVNSKRYATAGASGYSFEKLAPVLVKVTVGTYTKALSGK